MALVCPTVLASDNEEYKRQMGRVAHLGKRIQIDLTDGEFAVTKTVSPEDVWWPAGFKADIHLMYKQPLAAAKAVAPHRPNMFIVHAESDGNFEEMLGFCRHHDIGLGIALLAKTPPNILDDVVNRIDHVLIFSGDLGSFGGQADLSLLEKVDYLKKKNPGLEIGWDGGVNDRNISELVFGGVDVLNVGGYIQKSDNPEKAYSRLFRIAEETGTT